MPEVSEELLKKLTLRTPTLSGSLSGVNGDGMLIHNVANHKSFVDITS